MRIARVEMQGFRGFRDLAEIDIPAGFLIIQGANGAGKSTVCDAIEFCLTGGINKYPIEKAAKESVADYIWWRGEGLPDRHFVRVHFITTSGTPFVVTRTPEGCDKPDEVIRTQLCEVNAPDGAVHTLADTLLIRDESISALSIDISETDRFHRVQRALGAVQTGNLSARADEISRRSEAGNRAALADDDAIRKQLTSRLTQLSEAKAALASDQALEGAEREIRELIPNAPDGIGALITHARNWLTNSRRDVEARASALSRVVPLSAEYALLQTPQFAEQLAQTNGLVQTLDRQVADVNTEIQAAQHLLAAEREADQLAASLATLLNHGADLGRREGHCPLCDSALSEEAFRAAIATTRARLSAAGSRAGRAEAGLSEALAKQARVQQQLEIARQNLAAITARSAASDTIKVQIGQLVSSSGLSAEELRDPAAAMRRANEARELALLVEQKLRILESSRQLSQVREIEEGIRSLRLEADRSSERVAKSSRAMAAAKQIQHTIARTAGEMFDERLAMINPLLSELFLRLKPHGDWRSIEYRIRGDVRRFLSLSVGDHLNPQFVFSSGQRRVTGLAFLLSVHLSRDWCKLKTLMLDDPVQHIDDYRALNLVEVLAAIRKQGRQVICAVEDIALAKLLCRRLGTRVDQGGSLLTLESGLFGAAKVKTAQEVSPPRQRILDRISLSDGNQRAAETR